MVPKMFSRLLIVFCIGLLQNSVTFGHESNLNIVILYADDMGYGDLNIQNPDSRIPTPNLDQLAKAGARFTDGHSSSGVCTPSRYALLTGRHHFRKFHGIVGALGKSVLAGERVTLPEMLKQKGYSTACIGKWHLGWDWDSIKKRGAKAIPIAENSKRKVWPHDAFDWNKPIPDGPLAHGFDYYFGDAVINFPPYCWIENDRVFDHPDTTLTKVKNVTKEGNWEARPGPAVKNWDFYAVLPTLTKKGVEYIDSRKGSNQPFFLYFPLPSPHAPIVPNSQFLGKSRAGGYGDFVVETDWSCGQLLKALERNGLEDNTIVIFTSDNGPERYAYPRDKKFKHWSSGPFRGLKRDIYEGGHHVPFIIKWPGVTTAGSKRDGLVSQIDVMATLADYVDFELPKHAAEDSHNLLPYLKGESHTSPRTTHIHNTNKNRYAIRHNNWLLVKGKNGYHSRGFEQWEEVHGYPADDQSPFELYDLNKDIGQKNNVANQFSDVVEELDRKLEAIKSQGYSAPRFSKQPR